MHVSLIAEDILTTPEALWGSTDGTHVLYASFNDSEVRSLSYPCFGTGGASAGSYGTWSTFPESRSVRYPTVSIRSSALSARSRPR